MNIVNPFERFTRSQDRFFMQASLGVTLSIDPEGTMISVKKSLKGFSDEPAKIWHFSKSKLLHAILVTASR